MNYLVYLGLRNYDDAATRREFAKRSYALFAKEWRAQGHVHENYNATNGTGDDVANSDRFYYWGALLGPEDLLERVTWFTPNEIEAAFYAPQDLNGNPEPHSRVLAQRLLARGPAGCC
jgi:hypothetical protein